MTRRVEAVALVLVLAACGPRLGIRREVPPRADLTGSQLVSVAGEYREPVLGAWAALAKTELTPSAVRHLERALGRSGKFQVLPGCDGRCPQADTTVTVALTEVKVDPGDAKKEQSKQGSVTLHVEVYRGSALPLYTGNYWSTRRGGVPGTAEELADKALLRACIEGAVEDFVKDLSPRWVEESLRLEDEGPLKPIVELAARGDLDGAEALVRSVLATAPENPKAIYDLGVLFTARGQLEQARDAFKAAAARDPKYNWYLADAERRISDRSVLKAEGQ